MSFERLRFLPFDVARDDASEQPPEPLRFSLPPSRPQKVTRIPRTKNGKRTKSRNGCITCKDKRRKCDETRPICKTCAAREIECEGYGEKNMRWITETAPNFKFPKGPRNLPPPTVQRPLLLRQPLPTRQPPPTRQLLPARQPLPTLEPSPTFAPLPPVTSQCNIILPSVNYVQPNQQSHSGHPQRRQGYYYPIPRGYPHHKTTPWKESRTAASKYKRISPTHHAHRAASLMSVHDILYQQQL